MESIFLVMLIPYFPLFRKSDCLKFFEVVAFEHEKLSLFTELHYFTYLFRKRNVKSWCYMLFSYQIPGNQKNGQCISEIFFEITIFVHMPGKIFGFPNE